MFNNNSPNVYSLDSKPYGLSYEKWAVKWWQWLLSTSSEDNPYYDRTGENSAQNQIDSRVWFLAGTSNDYAFRKCKLPSGRAIFIPIINSAYMIDAERTASELSTLAKKDMDQVRNMDVFVDDVKLKNLESFRVQCEIFDVNLPERNIMGKQPGPTKWVSDGYWIMMEPLKMSEKDRK